MRLLLTGGVLLGSLLLAPTGGAAPPQGNRQAAGEQANKAIEHDGKPARAEAPQWRRNTGRAVVIRFHGMIAPMLEQYLYRKLDTAREMGAEVIILEIDSPGGTVDASLNVAARLRAIRWARTVAYIPRQALSGAAFVALGCDDIVMDPQAGLGDAGAIMLDEGAMFRYVPEKFVAPLKMRVRSLAEGRQRPPALAEAMVDKDLVVFRVENADTRAITYMSEAEIASDENPDRWKKLEPVFESRAGHFLQVTGTRAVELGLAEATVDSRDQLLRRYGIEREPPILAPTAMDTAVYVLNWPGVTILLFLIGLVALYVEFTAPGVGMGLLVAGLCFALFFWSRFLGGTADWLEIVLFAAGLAFLGVEIFIIPGFGVSGITGLLLVLASLVLASQDFVVPQTRRDFTTLVSTLLVLMLSSGGFVAAAALLSRHIKSVPILRRMVLSPEPPAVAGGGGGSAEATIQVGDVGMADSPLRPSGKARFGNRFVDVLTDGEFVARGAAVRVVLTSGNRVIVTATGGAQKSEA